MVFKTINGGESWHPIKDIPSLEGMNNGTTMAYKAIYKNNLLVIPTKMNDDVFLMNYSFDKGNSWHISNKTINTSQVAVSFSSSYYGWVINSENGGVYQIIKRSKMDKSIK